MCVRMPHACKRGLEGWRGSRAQQGREGGDGLTVAALRAAAGPLHAGSGGLPMPSVPQGYGYLIAIVPSKLRIIDVTWTGACVGTCLT
jgi:hypothetical protein